MRGMITGVFCVLVVALATCAAIAWRSGRVMGRHVARLLVALVPPVIGNLLIVWSTDPTLETLGCYTYYLGMDLTMFELLAFTESYCAIDYWNRPVSKVVSALLVADVVQLLLNPVFGHAFATQTILVDGMPYLRMVPLTGQVFHRVVDYGIFLSTLAIFAYKTLHVPFIYSERYSIILLVMVFAGAWQSFYIFSGTPVDRSMIGFGVFGLLIFYFALYYRPLRLLDRMLAGVVSDMAEALFFLDVDGSCIYANAAGLALADVSEKSVELARERLQELLGDMPIDVAKEWSVRRTVGEGSARQWFELSHKPATDGRQKVVGSFLSVRDRTQEELELQREVYNATHDDLTGLYNKECLYTSIRRMLDEHPEVRFTVGTLDVKDFKIVNDVYSTEFGDHVLRTIADWIRAVAGRKTVYGRIAGDKFGFLVPTALFDPKRIEHELEDFVVSDGTVEHMVLLHLGAYEVSEPHIDVSVMFDRAFLALATIKSDVKRHIAFYDEEMRSRVVWDQTITAQLADAIEQGQIRPYLQPMVDGLGRVVGAEALVRWIHPEEGFLSPASFIPVFEQNGMIAEVDRHMWRCACELLADWKRRGIDLFLSVNISPKDFYFMDVADEICALVDEYGIDPSRLRLEITETVMMSDLENRVRMLDDLRSAGFLVEMDDFGSGYSSLNMLKDMPVDVLKIDMAFLYGTKNKRDEHKARTILQNIINLSGDLGIPSLTEGVETDEQYHMLSRMGCKLFQGYFFARPMPVEDFESFCRVA